MVKRLATRRAALVLVASMLVAVAAVAVSFAAYDDGATIASATSDQGLENSGASAISNDGRYVAFATDATNFYPAGVTADPTNRAQRVALTGSPSGGAFTLTFEGETTGAINRTATAAGVESALEALPGVEPAEVSVTKPASYWVVAWDSPYVPLMTGDGSGLTGGTSPGVSVTQEPARHIGGLFRKDLQTGEMQLVAEGTVRQATANAFCGPRYRGRVGISANGRYVAFETEHPLVADDDASNAGPDRDVYVRDMTKAIDAADAYELVSALDGGSAAATYDSVAVGGNGCRPGSVLPAGGRAVSADGRKVIFSNAEGKTSLPGGGPAATPIHQLFVRDLDADTTELVTQDPGGGPVGDGCGEPNPEDCPEAQIAGAAISADGTTVTWLGGHAPEQTEFVPGEVLAGQEEEVFGRFYYMWRRISAGSPVTRRVTGEVDPDDPACNTTVAADGQAAGINAVDPDGDDPDCLGPLQEAEQSSSGCSTMPAPAVSADGRRVAHGSCSAVVGAPDGASQWADLFVANMGDTVTRKAGVTELTRGPGGLDPQASSGPIEGIGISADGSRIAFTTARNQFVLPEPVVTGGLPGSGDRLRVFVIDLAAAPDTLEWASQAHGGGDLNPGSTDPDNGVGKTLTLSENGARVAFETSAANLLPPPPGGGNGDGNGFVDVFVLQAHAAPAAQCSDGADNDGDGQTDFPNDPGCSSGGDDDEANAPPDGGGGTTPPSGGGSTTPPAQTPPAQTPPAQTPPVQTPPPGFGSTIRVTPIVGRSLRLPSRGRLSIPVQNDNAFTVTGTATLITADPVAARNAGASARRKRRITLGTQRLSIRARTRGTVVIAFSRKNQAVLRRLKKVRVTLKLSLRDPNGTTRNASKTFVLTAPKGRR